MVLFLQLPLRLVIIPVIGNEIYDFEEKEETWLYLKKKQ
jgi:hypothetical protein